jgi:hypothetical protein
LKEKYEEMKEVLKKENGSNSTSLLSCLSIGVLIISVFGVLAYRAMGLENGPKEKRPFVIVPGNIPNQGIMFVDHEKEGRSGHGHSAITECKNNDILAFYANTDAEIWGGHSVAGWSEYKRSTDGGKTWSDPIVLDYSKSIWEGDNEVYSALVFWSNYYDEWYNLYHTFKI